MARTKRILKLIATATFICSINLIQSCASAPRLIGAAGNLDSLNYKIRAGDVIEIKSPKYPAFNQVVIVGPDGKASLQAIGEIEVRNLTPRDFETILNRKYSFWLDDPSIKVFIEESSEFKVFVTGDVEKPGVIRFKGNLTIEQGILLAGGFKDKLSDHKVYVFRNKNSTGVKMYRIMLRKRSAHSRAARNFELAPFDIIWVMKYAGMKEHKKGRMI